MSQYIIHSIKPRSQHEHEGYYSPNLSYKPIIKFDGVVKVFPPDNAKNDTKHPVVRYDWKAYDKSGKLVKTYGSSISCDWRMLSDKVFIEKQIKGIDFSNGRFWYIDGEVSNTELAKAANAIQLALKEYAKSNPEFVAAPHPQHSGYYSPNLRHSDEDVDVIDCTSNPDYLSVKMSAIDDLDDDYLEHHGILGMKWGIRRYQNSDGSLTPEGKVRYGSQMAKALQKGDQRSYDKIRSKIKEGSDNDLLEKVANQLNDSGKKASKKNYSDALKKTEAEALENKRKEYARVVKEKVESGKEDNARLYAEYHDDLYNDKDSNVSKTSSEDYKRNGYMSNAERQTFNYAEKACKNLPDDKKDYFLRQLSNSFDAIVRDNPSVLVWDNKKNKIVAYPSSYEFERVPDFEKYRYAWASNDGVWLYTWGEQYDG